MRGRLVILLAVVAAAVAIAGEAGVMPPPGGGSGAGAPRTTVPVHRGLPPAVCPGPETLLAPAGAAPLAPGGVVRLRALLATDQAGGPAEATAWLRPLATGGGLAGRLAGRLRAEDGDAGITQGALDRAGATVLSVPVSTPDSTASSLPEIAALQSTVATTGDIHGLVATGCSAAGSDLWLVGGGSLTGRRGRLLLTNPSSTAAVTVDVTVHGPSGVVPAPAGQGIVLPAGGQAALLLDALAPGLPAAVVHVRARSGRVVGTLHDSLVRGLVPGGADDVPLATGPATRQVVAGLLVQHAVGSTGASPAGHDAASREAAATAAGATAVRVAVPGRDEAIVRVRLMGPAGLTDLGAGGVATVPSGAVADIPVTGVPNGVYAALVQSDVPVVAGAIVGRASPGSTLAGTPRIRPGRPRRRSSAGPPRHRRCAAPRSWRCRPGRPRRRAGSPHRRSPACSRLHRSAAEPR